ncbi:MAG: ABC transporter substrate-binding protein [Candidatus Fermentibacteria bacterium]|nr:ABC transporter substrate-binding protein [Candidatus Fermentibacteria bacterium]
MRKIVFALLAFLVASFVVGCGDQTPQPVVDSQVDQIEPVEDSGAENIPVEDVVMNPDAVSLKIGFVKQDHHTAVFVAALRAEMMHEQFPVYLIPLGESFYALIKDNEQVAEIEFIQSQGAINVPNNMQAGLFELGFGGVVPFAASIDQGNPIVMVSPLHQRGDMLVVRADNGMVSDWDTFLAWVNASEEPVTIGFKSPKAVALIIFQSALTESNISFAMSGGDLAGAQVVLYNAQGQPNLNPALQEGMIDAYISNNPACAMAEHNGIGKCVAELSMLPPGDFENHPCCAIAATEEVLAAKPRQVAAALELFAYATEFINENPEEAAAAASEWIGTPYEVELISMATSLYDVHVTEDWTNNMGAILNHMRGLNVFTGPLLDASSGAEMDIITNFSFLPEEYR